MITVRTNGAVVVGATSVPVTCTVTGTPGPAYLSITGMPAHRAESSSIRIHTALRDNGLSWSDGDLAAATDPSWLPGGDGLDLAIAVAALAATGQVPTQPATRFGFIAELDVDGRLRSADGVFPAVVALHAAGFDHIVTTPAGAGEAALVDGITVHAADHLRRVVEFLRGQPVPAMAVVDPDRPPHAWQVTRPTATALTTVTDPRTCRIVEIAAAGGHHAPITAPASGTADDIAAAIAGVLPDLTGDQAAVTASAHSLAGCLDTDRSVFHRPPMVTVPADAIQTDMTGTGNPPRPGAIAAAHHGVLFLPDATEHERGVHHALDQPLRDGEISTTRSHLVATYPARFQLVLAVPPCRCHQRHTAGEPVPPCSCRRLEARLRNRLHLQVSIPPPSPHATTHPGDTSAQAAASVAGARATAADRWPATHAHSPTNTSVPITVLHGRPFRLPPAVTEPIDRRRSDGGISPVVADGIVRIGWTIADLAGRTTPCRADIQTALDLGTAR